MVEIKIPEYINKIMNHIEENGFEAYLVGGCIRDSILGVDINDYDLSTNASLTELLDMFKDFYIINNNGLKHNTITLRYDHNNIEITSFKHNTDEDNSIEIDLSHRDLSINAMAYNYKRGLIDPHGGLDSINNKILRTPIEPEIIIKEDYLRILRVLRFSSILDFDIDEKLINVIFNLYPNIVNISKERIKKELDGILIGKRAKDILLKYKDIICTIIPKLKPCVGFNQNNKYHIHDVYEHIAYTVGYSEPILNVRIAALLHDIAKPLCYSEDSKGGHFYHHPEVSANMALKILDDLRCCKSDIKEIYYLIKYHDREIAYNEKSVKKLLSITPDNNIDYFKHLIYLKIADRLDHINLDSIDYFKYMNIAYDILSDNACLAIKDLKINGNDLISLGHSGKKIGIILEDVLDNILNYNLDNNYDDIIKFVKNKY